MLKRALPGKVLLPGETGYDQAVQLQVATYDAIRPAGVVYCQTAADVRDCVLFAGDHAIQVTPRSGGHCNAGYSTSPGLVVDLSRMNSARLAPTSVTLDAGIQAVDALDQLAPRGIATPNGTCATVAAGGFITGGGIGLMTRAHGAACDLLTSAEMVLADGRIVRCTTLEKSDLFWALRGGGGNFGIVTRFRLRPIQLTTLVSYFLAWPWSAAAEVFEAWQRWIRHLPEELSANLVVQLADAAPGAVPMVLVSGTSLGSQSDVETLLDVLEFQVGSAPVSRTVLDLPYQPSMMQWWQCAGKTPAQSHRVGYSPVAELPRNVWAMSRGRFFDRELPPAGIDRLLTAFDADRRAGQLRAVSLRAMGGKANEKDRTATAFVHRTSKFYLGLAYALLSPKATIDDHCAVQNALSDGFEAIDPYSNGESFQNFMDPFLGDWQRAYYAENYARLVRVKRRYDPDGFFTFPQSIGS